MNRFESLSNFHVEGIPRRVPSGQRSRSAFPSVTAAPSQTRTTQKTSEQKRVRTKLDKSKSPRENQVKIQEKRSRTVDDREISVSESHESTLIISTTAKKLGTSNPNVPAESCESLNEEDFLEIEANYEKEIRKMTQKELSEIEEFEDGSNEGGNDNGSSSSLLTETEELIEEQAVEIPLNEITKTEENTSKIKEMLDESATVKDSQQPEIARNAASYPHGLGLTTEETSRILNDLIQTDEDDETERNDDVSEVEGTASLSTCSIALLSC